MQLTSQGLVMAILPLGLEGASWLYCPTHMLCRAACQRKDLAWSVLTWSGQRLQPEPRGKRGSQRPQQGILGASGIQPGFYPACRTACHVIARLGGAGIAPSSLNGSGPHEQAVQYTDLKDRGHVVYAEPGGSMEVGSRG